MHVRLIITKLPQPVVNTKACNFPLMLIVLLLLKVLTNAPVGVTVDNKILKSWKGKGTNCVYKNVRISLLQNLSSIVASR